MRESHILRGIIKFKSSTTYEELIDYLLQNHLVWHQIDHQNYLNAMETLQNQKYCYKQVGKYDNHAEPGGRRGIFQTDPNALSAGAAL